MSGKEDPLISAVRSSYQSGGLRAAMLSFVAGRRETRQAGFAQDHRSVYFSKSMYTQLALLQSEDELGKITAFYERFMNCYKELALQPLFLSEVSVFSICFNMRASNSCMRALLACYDIGSLDSVP